MGSALFAGFIAGGHLTIGIVFAGLIVRCSCSGHLPLLTLDSIHIHK